MILVIGASLAGDRVQNPFGGIEVYSSGILTLEHICFGELSGETVDLNNSPLVA